MPWSSECIEAFSKGSIYLLLLDREGNIVEGAHGIRSFSGSDIRQMKDLIDIVCSDDIGEKELLSEALTSSLNGNHPPPVTFRRILPPGTESWMTVRFVPLEDGASVLILDNDTPHTSLPVPPEVEQLAGVGVIAANSAHEFNNVLTSILGWTQLAKMNSSNPETIESALEIIESNARRAKHIAFELIGLSKPSAHEPELILLRHLVEDVLKFLSWRLKRTRIKTVYDFESEEKAWGDRQHLYQTFLNICVNAVEAMQSGGVLTAAVCRSGDMAEVSFTDTGAGIPPEIKDRIFDPYFSTKTRSMETGTGGSGLGLSICRRIIEEHNGEVIIESGPEGGSVFRILLPRARKEASIEVTGTEEVKPSGKLARNLRVLVIDDEQDIREMLKTVLSLKGIGVVTASDGDDGLAQLKKHRFDVVLLDYLMPGTPARDVLSAVVDDEDAPPFVLLSGRADILERELPAGVAATLRKPFDIQEVLSVIQSVTSS